MKRHRRATVFLLAMALCLAPGQVPAAHAQETPPRVTTKLPRWLAPGGALYVAGWAAPNQRVRLLAGTRLLATTTSGPRGLFRLRARAPRSGWYWISVATPTGSVRVGLLRVRPLILAAVGDVTFGARVGQAIRAYGPRYPWLSVAPVLRAADIAVGNLEGAVSLRGSPVPGKEFTFRGPPWALAAAAYFAGMDVMSVANNHSLDYGRVAFIDTLRYAARFGVATPGGGINLGVARLPRVERVGGLRIAFLAYSDVRPAGFDAGPRRAGAAPAFPSLIAADVRRARSRADVVVVYFHWGIERTFRPTARQRALASVSFRSGATIVLGCHPHVLQSIARLRTKLVAWSLGNFVFGANSYATDRTGILRIGLTRAGVVGHAFRRARIGGAYRIQPRLVR